MVREVSVREARKEISRLLDSVESGEEVVIRRRGVPVARLVGVEERGEGPVKFPSRRDLRSRMAEAQTPASELVRELRDERG